MGEPLVGFQKPPGPRWRFMAITALATAVVAWFAISLLRPPPPSAPTPAGSASRVIATDDSSEIIEETIQTPDIPDPSPSPSRKAGCIVRSSVDDAGARHFIEDCRD